MSLRRVTGDAVDCSSPVRQVRSKPAAAAGLRVSESRRRTSFTQSSTESRKMKRFVTLSILLILAAFGADAQELGGFGSDTTVGPRDVLEIKVLEDPTITNKYTVTEDGQVVLNVVGKLSVSGQTTAQIEAILKT